MEEPEHVDVERPLANHLYQQTAYLNLPPTYDPPEYDFDNDPYWSPDETVYWQGSRGSGKTTGSTIYILKRRHAYPNVFVMTNTAANNHWQQFVPENNIVEGLQEDFFQQLLDEGMETKREYQTDKALGQTPYYSPFTAVILEDLLDTKVLRSSKAVNRAILNGRHAATAIHILSQDYTGLDRPQRNNIDRFVFYKTTDLQTRETLVRQYGASFLSILDRVTNDENTVLMLNNRKRTPKKHMLMKWTIDKRYLDKAMKSPTKVLGNNICWGDIDPAEQRMKFPTTSVRPTYDQMRRNFNHYEKEDKDGRARTSHIDGTHAPEPESEEDEDDDGDIWRIRLPTWFSSRFGSWWQ